ncbi:hypothetical protein HKX48_000857 [Thoreauomyces humboldtii]|nr:hypothetical protein HKX48_000857 [Thoreauomyces humboldtii]
MSRALNRQTWTRLIRFQTADNDIVYGDVGLDEAGKVGQDLAVRVLEGNPFSGGRLTDRVAKVQKLLCPIPRPPIVLGIGLNYLQHAKELKASVPTSPILFTKPGSSVVGPFSDINIPVVAQEAECDYEAELAVVIGTTCRNVPQERAMEVVAGVTCANDITARVWQRTGSQWNFGKSFDDFAPIGPVLVAPQLLPTLNEPGPAGGLAISLTLNGKTMQSSRTSDMIFGIPALISFLSQGTTLEAGTVILTGTPAGVGTGRIPKIVLKDGDRLAVSIEGLGTLVNRVKYESDALFTTG